MSFWVGSIDVDLVPAEITYGIVRIGTYLQGVNRVMDLRWSDDLTWADVFLKGEVEWCHYNFDQANTELLFHLFSANEAEAVRLLGQGLVAPGYDHVIKCSHAFNMLEARGAISVTERTGYIGRVRKLARLCAHAYLADREAKGFPMLKKQ